MAQAEWARGSRHKAARILATCGSPELRGGEIFPLDVLLGSISRMKSADVIFSAERRIGWFACPIFARRKVLICRTGRGGYAARRSYR